VTVTKEQAIQAMRDLPGDREESERTLGIYLDQSVDAAFERAFGAPPATDEPPAPKGEA
jgi:hypothetical protein